MDQVRARLAQERARILERVAKMLDEELGTKPAEGAAIGDADKKIRELEEKRARLRRELAETEFEMLRARWAVRDADVRAEAARKNLKTEDAVKPIFDENLELHRQKKFDESIRGFKLLYYGGAPGNYPVTSAYNVSCGYALKGEKEPALDWLEISMRMGFRDISHIKTDADLDGLREEPRYKALIREKGSD